MSVNGSIGAGGENHRKADWIVEKQMDDHYRKSINARMHSSSYINIRIRVVNTNER